MGTRVPAPLALPQAPGDLEPVEVREHHVQHHEVGPLAADGVERRPARRHPVDVEAVVAEAHGDELGDVLLVVDDEHAGLATGVGHGTSVRGGPGRP